MEHCFENGLKGRAAFCYKSLGLLQRFDHTRVEPVSPEQSPEIFSMGWPIRWNCYIGERLRKEHSELVTERKGPPSHDMTSSCTCLPKFLQAGPQSVNLDLLNG